jgi:hypothetical protein
VFISTRLFFKLIIDILATIHNYEIRAEGPVPLQFGRRRGEVGGRGGARKLRLHINQSVMQQFLDQIMANRAPAQ